MPTECPRCGIRHMWSVTTWVKDCEAAFDAAVEEAVRASLETRGQDEEGCVTAPGP